MNVHRHDPVHTVLSATALAASMLVAHATLAQTATAPANPPAANTSAPAADIHDIRGPKPVTAPWLIPLIAGTSLLGLGGVYATWAWNRRRVRDANHGPAAIALARLDQVRRLMAPQRGREFSIELSSVVREYIESRFDLLATHLTTDEFLRHLLEPVDSLLAEHRPLLDQFLQTCDLAKFGGWTLAALDMEAMLNSARLFIEASANDDKLPRRPRIVADVAQSDSATSGETYVSLPTA